MAPQRPASITDAFLEKLVARVPSTAGGTWKLTEVYTGEVLVELPQSTPADIEPAFATAREAQVEWAARPLNKRLAVFKRAHTLFLDNAETTTDLIQAESGKNRRMAIEETCDPAMVISHYLKRAPKLLAPTKRGGPVPFVSQLDRDPPAQGRRRHHRAVELPVRDRPLRRHPGADGRQRDRAQARQQDRALAALRHLAARGGRPAEGAVPGRLRRGPGRRSDADRQRQLRDVHRLDRDRPRDRRARRPQPDRLLPRARRQEPDDRARGRRPRRGRPGRALRRVRQHRPDLHAHRADVPAGVALRRVQEQVRRGDRGAEGRRVVRLRHGGRLAGLGRPQGPRASRTSTTPSPRARRS